MHKYEIVLALGRRCGYRDYLELATPTTGLTFARVDKEQFPNRTRIMYRCPREFSDGEPLHVATDGVSSEQLFQEVMRTGRRFDLVFVDPFHDYASSLRDIVFALHVLKPGGAVVIHDCSPPDAHCAAPEFQDGEWCGVTYAAYLDVVLAAGIRYATVDSDFGCGIISTHPSLAGLCGPAPDPDLVHAWRRLAPGQRYPYFDANRSRLLNLIPPAEFQRRLGEQAAG
jgi:hypothetical protein